METNNTYISIEPRLYTITKAAEQLGVDHTYSAFYKTYIASGKISPTYTEKGQIRISSIELTKYILSRTVKVSPNNNLNK